MSEATTARALMLAFFVSLALMGIPLARGWVPRNRWFGLRISATLSDDRVWFPVNRSMGRALIWLGLGLAGLSAAWIAAAPGIPLTYLLILVAIAAPLMIAYGAHRAQEIKASLGE